MTLLKLPAVAQRYEANRTHRCLSRRSFTVGIATILASAHCVAAPLSNNRFISYPAWFARDLARKAQWLPELIERLGIEDAYVYRFNAFPQDIQRNLITLKIPHWFIALVPTDLSKLDEIHKQLRFMTSLAGDEPRDKYSKRFEQLAVFAGGAQLPTPGEASSGQSLGDEGCAAAISRYLLAQLKMEYAELEILDQRLFNSQSSAELKKFFLKEQVSRFVRVRQVEFANLRRADFKAGSILIAEKPGGTHVMAWTRVPRSWNWDESDLMAVANTGLKPFGDRMILAQDYVTSDLNLAGHNVAELRHNAHGPINSVSLGVLSDPKTNIYAAKGSKFFMIDILDPDVPTTATPSSSKDLFTDVPLPRGSGKINQAL